MLDREPPIFISSSDGLSPGQLAAGGRPKKSWLSIAFLTLLAVCLSFLGLIFGFIYGDSFGRRNAQYDNPALREYYAGKCYDFWETQFKQTLNASLQDQANLRKDQNQKLDEIFAKMNDMEKALAEFTTGGDTPKLELEKSSVATAVKPLAPKKL